MSPTYFAGWQFFRIVFATYFRWRVFNPERVPHQGAVILAANHASFLDPPLVGVAIQRPINYLARESLFRFPVVRTILTLWNAVPVDRDGGGAKGLRIILDRLLGGGGIILFPEGTRTPDGQLQAARTGVGLIVVKSSAPVVPVRIFGTFEAFGRNHGIPRPFRVSIKFGKPLLYEVLRTEAKQCSKSRLREIYEEISTDVMLQIHRLEPHRDLTTFPV